MPEKQDMIHLSTLPVFESRGQIVTNSRDVAALIGKRHKDVMRQIRTMQAHLTGRNFAPSDFFIPATYTDSTGRELPCYYLTQMGCEMVANKAAGITDRDRAHVEELTALMLIERVIAEEIRAGIAAGKPYKEIYTAIQQRLLTFGEITGTATPCLTAHNAPHGTFAVGEYTDITENENDGTAQLTGGKEE